MLSMDSLAEVNLTVRGIFTVSLMLSLMAVYFALIQQRALAMPSTAEAMRLWLWKGRKRTVSTIGAHGESRTIRESSLASNIVIQAPFELLSISITLFLGGLAAYLGLAMVQNVNLGTGPWPGNAATFIFFLVCTVFALAMFGQSLGDKDREFLKCKKMGWGLRRPVSPS